MREHKGTIDVESLPGQGTTFILTFPRHWAGLDIVSRGRVLIVDDEPDMVENCARILGGAGYECLTASDPRRGLTMLETSSPDLLITDLKMPEAGRHGAPAPRAGARRRRCP